MKLYITQEAHDLIHSQFSTEKAMELVGKAMNFENTAQYRRNRTIARVLSTTSSTAFLGDSPLCMRHFFADDILLLFCRSDACADIDKQLAGSFEFSFT